MKFFRVFYKNGWVGYCMAKSKLDAEEYYLNVNTLQNIELIVEM